LKPVANLFQWKTKALESEASAEWHLPID